MDEILTAKELAQFLKLPIQSLRRMARLDVIPSYRIGRLMRFEKSKVLAKLESHAPLDLSTLRK